MYIDVAFWLVRVANSAQSGRRYRAHRQTGTQPGQTFGSRVKRSAHWQFDTANPQLRRLQLIDLAQPGFRVLGRFMGFFENLRGFRSLLGRHRRQFPGIAASGRAIYRCFDNANPSNQLRTVSDPCTRGAVYSSLRMHPDVIRSLDA